MQRPSPSLVQLPPEICPSRWCALRSWVTGLRQRLLTLRAVALACPQRPPVRGDLGPAVVGGQHRRPRDADLRPDPRSRSPPLRRRTLLGQGVSLPPPHGPFDLPVVVLLAVVYQSGIVPVDGLWGGAGATRQLGDRETCLEPLGDTESAAGRASPPAVNGTPAAGRRTAAPPPRPGSRTSSPQGRHARWGRPGRPGRAELLQARRSMATSSGGMGTGRSASGDPCTAAGVVRAQQRGAGCRSVPDHPPGDLAPNPWGGQS